MQPAPLHDDVADGPPEGRAFWLRAKDGVRLRIGVWSSGTRGTVLLFPGRTEYIEKYGRAATDLAARGFATVAVDWRGQGLADRLLPDTAVGHVGAFGDYQRDVAAVMAVLPALNLPQPLFLLAHSLGGCIGLRALMHGLPVRAAAFTGPMWDILMPGAMRPLAWIIGAGSGLLGKSGAYAPGTSGRRAYVEAAAFDGNSLTSDADMYHYMQAQLAAHPGLRLGGPSIGWVHAALAETRDLARRPSPPLPALCFLGSDEQIVAPDAIRSRMARWPGGRLEVIEGARHEIMMETPAIRAACFDKIARFFETTP